MNIYFASKKKLSVKIGQEALIDFIFIVSDVVSNFFL